MTEEEKAICKKYSARDEEGLVHCMECPLVISRYSAICKATEELSEKWRAENAGNFITKDEVMKWMKNHFDVSRYYHPYSKLENYRIPYTEIESMVKRMPTIDAIPVEWIEDWYSTKADKPFVADDVSVRLLLRDWREEHETD